MSLLPVGFNTKQKMLQSFRRFLKKKLGITKSKKISDINEERVRSQEKKKFETKFFAVNNYIN